MNNYEYCAEYAVAAAKGARISVLDYGCGAGEIVNLLRTKDIDAFGCDIFYDAGDRSKSISEQWWGTIIRRIEDGRIPFADESFDLVISNQVMEHVDDLDLVLSEIHRVLKKGGQVLSLFPDKGVWREGHCGLPFLHWFSKGSKLRIYYALLLRMMGFGYHKEKHKGLYGWSEHFCGWLDKWTYYRSYSDILNTYNKYFIDIRHFEDHWLDQRFANKHLWMKSLPIALKRMLARKLGHLVFVCTKE